MTAAPDATDGPDEGSWGLLVGYGSIGRHHAAVLSKRYGRLVVVDAQDAARARAADAHPTAEVVAALDDITRAAEDWERCTAVVATWGPTHAHLFDALADLGVRRILVEKPVATSVHAAVAMAERADRDGIALGCHLHMRYSGLVGALRALADQHALGRPVSVIVQGGARCLVTNGIHYVDFTSALLDAQPDAVTSTAAGDLINPRSPDLGFYGGTGVWSYPEGRELVVTFSNHSSLYEHVSIYYRDAVLQMSPFYEVTLRARDADAVRDNPPVTRAGAPSELLYTGSLGGVAELPEATERILVELETGKSHTLSAMDAAAGLGAVVGALQSGLTGVKVPLPIAPDTEVGQREWPIS